MGKIRLILPDKYRPAAFVIEGVAMIYLSTVAFRDLRDYGYYYLLFNSRLLLGEAFIMGISWCLGWIVFFHGFAIWRHRRAAKRLETIYFNKNPS